MVAFEGPQLRYFLINSQPAAFQRKNQSLMAHQVELLARDHSFLKRDSVLDCSQLVGGPTLSELEDLYESQSPLVLGRVAASPRRAVRSVVGSSELLTGKEQKAILAIW